MTDKQGLRYAPPEPITTLEQALREIDNYKRLFREVTVARGACLQDFRSLAQSYLALEQRWSAAEARAERMRQALVAICDHATGEYEDDVGNEMDCVQCEKMQALAAASLRADATR